MPSFDAVLASVLAKFASAKTSSSDLNQVAARVRVEGEMVHVRGQLDTYRVHLSTGAIIRERDGRRMQVDTEAAQLPRSASPGGAADLITQIFILAEDATHAHALRTVTE